LFLRAWGWNFKIAVSAQRACPTLPLQPLEQYWGANWLSLKKGKHLSQNLAQTTPNSTNSGGSAPLKLLSLQLSIGWKKEICPICGLERESISHLFGSSSAIPRQEPLPLQAFFQATTLQEFTRSTLLLWAIWKIQNKVIHTGQLFSPSSILIIYLQEFECFNKWQVHLARFQAPLGLRKRF